MRWQAVMFALVVAACGGEGGDDSGCEGTAPQIEDCPRGFFFAECGGVGDFRLGCRDNGECYWFTGGCVAQGFTPSDCDASRICCHQAENYAAGARWPYEDGFAESLDGMFYGLGRGTWDRARAMNLGVVVDPTLVATPTSWTCEGDAVRLTTGLSPCEALPLPTSATLGATLSVFTQYSAISGWNPLAEIDLAAGTARLCAFFYTDVRGPMCTGGEALCADAGTITISRTPSAGDDLIGLVMTVDVSFDGGAYVFRGTTTVEDAR